MPGIELDLDRRLPHQVIMRLPSRSRRSLFTTEVASRSSSSARPRASRSTREVTTAALFTCTGDDISFFWSRGCVLQHVAPCFVLFDDSTASQQRARVSWCYVVKLCLEHNRRKVCCIVCKLVGQGLLEVAWSVSNTYGAAEMDSPIYIYIFL